MLSEIDDAYVVLSGNRISFDEIVSCVFKFQKQLQDVDILIGE